MNETDILRSISNFIKDNPDSNIKEKIKSLLEDNKDISFLNAVDIMNEIRKTLGIPSVPVDASDFCRVFTDSFNNFIKIKMADCFIKTPNLYEIVLIEMLNKILDKISFEKYHIIKMYLESNGYKLIDIEQIVRFARLKLKS